MCDRERIVARRAAEPRRVAVAMSGGVDSSMAAALLLDRGCDVFGVHLRVADGPQGSAPPAHATPPARAAGSESAAPPVEAAGAAAAALGIELRVLDVREDFLRKVIAPFIDEYLAGRTPNPCVGCNRAVKFGVLLERALEWGAEALATGHYARARFEDGRWRLLRGLARGKDQSYYLCRLRQDQLERFVAPLGELASKDDTRAMARQRGLPVAGRRESQDICFIHDNDYKAFIEARAPGRLPGEGDIVDTQGDIVGRHQGAWRYTIGQRRGLGVSAPAPLYVVAIDMPRNRVVVGPWEAALSRELVAEDVNYVSIPPIERPIRCGVQIRYRHSPARATAEPVGAGATRLRVVFDEPQSAVAPGQAAVLYDGDVVLGGGWIS